MEIIAFYLLLLFVFILSGFIFTALIQRIKDINFTVSILLGIGISAYVITLVMYYLLLLIEKHSILFYCILLMIFLVIVFYVVKREFINVHVNTFKIIKKYYLLLIPLLVFIAGWTFYITNRAISEHDTLEYAVQGKVFFRDLEINYSKFRFDEFSHFFYVGLHGFSFPLLATFEQFFNSIIGVKSDLFFRAINSIFGILTLLFVFEIARKNVNLIFAVATVFTLGLTYGFFETIMKYHIDLYRIFYLSSSIYLCYLIINNYSKQLLILCALFVAAQANAHSLGCLISIIQIVLLFLFLGGAILERLKKMTLFFALFLLFGGIHYLLDVIYGTGWIFQDIKFY